MTYNVCDICKNTSKNIHINMNIPIPLTVYENISVIEGESLIITPHEALCRTVHLDICDDCARKLDKAIRKCFGGKFDD